MAINRVAQLLIAQDTQNKGGVPNDDAIKNSVVSCDWKYHKKMDDAYSKLETGIKSIRAFAWGRQGASLSLNASYTDYWTPSKISLFKMGM